MNLEQLIKGALYGTAIGDALGVPVEFKSRDYLMEHPITDFIGYMCWNQPPGTFSDDSSMTFCTAESLIEDFNVEDIAQKFILWYKEGYWGAHDEVFDIGGATRRSLNRIINGESPLNSGALFAEDNGNGALMRILPIVFYLRSESDIAERYKKVKQLASITHAHFRSGFSCFLFVEFILFLLKYEEKKVAYVEMQKTVLEFANLNDFNAKELTHFERLLKYDITGIPENEIKSTGYVLDSLESAIWCFMSTNSYEDATLKAINLGGDTDTTGAITGGLSGCYYGLDSIPEKWIEGIAKRTEINDLSNRFLQAILKRETLHNTEHR